MSFTISSVSPDSILSDGGHQLTVTGVFEKGHQYRVYLGDVGGLEDPVCYSGIPGQGYFINPKQSVAGGAFDTLLAYSPRVNSSETAYSITVQDAGTLEDHVLLNVVLTVKNQFFTTVYSERKMQPPHYKTGPRSIDKERPTA